MAALIDLRGVVLQLQELTGISTAELARLAEVHRPNMLAWLAGKPQVFSEKNQLKVCDALGWRFGRLRRDMIHRWEVGNDLTTCHQVLSAYEEREGEVLTVFQANGANAVKAGIVIGSFSGIGPLVVLIQRPLGFVVPGPITAKTLDVGQASSIHHHVSVGEWQECWHPGSKGLSPAEYLNSYGKIIFEASKPPIPLLPQDDECIFFDESFRLIAESENDPDAFNVEEEVAWAGVLFEAKHAGMRFDEILARTKSALGLKE